MKMTVSWDTAPCSLVEVDLMMKAVGLRTSETLVYLNETKAIVFKIIFLLLSSAHVIFVWYKHCTLGEESHYLFQEGRLMVV
jgi:hypothetical protein